ncbi:IMP cyclohydrolase [Alkalispirochaeta sphaeroplastigenens]|uniref:IMP cyclohydrolase n=1 Tax=Alkalispirochaeta sphaeroplastigenens TaxID=1187066 RepID=A0A2S4K0F6_9SPIO|nr:IMP cyclohydrolase [Alkalispirochaeta sphaeroplastigenens]POR05252.1 IMP cyclohydrolase [Alkalispirochaeta sphaeroplastigenens]
MSRSIYRTINTDGFPEDLEISFGSGSERQTLCYRKVTWDVAGERQGLRYGENPDQQAALYRPVNGNLLLGQVHQIAPGRGLASEVDLLQSGKHPGKINITDVDAALNILRYFTDRPACVIVKHNNPSGVALGSSLAEAYQRALMADRIAAFGGAVALNGEVDRETAQAIASYYAEVVVAPEFSAGALEVFATKKNLRVLRVGNMARLQEYVGTRFVDFKSLIDGGLVAQWSFVPKLLPDEELLPAQAEHQGRSYGIEREPTQAERRDMRFGWLVESGVTSNSVIYVKDEATVAIGTGEQDRVGVARIAREKAFWKLADRLCLEATGKGIEELGSPEEQEPFHQAARKERGGLPGSTMISDAFFPFRDGAEVGLREGVSAILQPGGALRDHEVIEACNHFGATMVFTGQRSFRH